MENLENHNEEFTNTAKTDDHVKIDEEMTYIEKLRAKISQNTNKVNSIMHKGP